MTLMRTRTVGLVWLATLLVLPAAPASAQDEPPPAPAPELVASDPYGDVSLGQPSQGIAPLPLTDSVDLTEVRLFAESGESVRFQAKIADISAEWVTQSVSGFTTWGIQIFFCFSWNNVPFAARVQYSWRDPEPYAMSAILGALESSCTTSGASLTGPTETIRSFLIDPEYNQIDVVLEKTALGRLGGAAPPAAGDALTQFFVVMRDARGLRYDWAPSSPSEESFTFEYGTANQGALQLSIQPNALRNIPCKQQRFLPMYAVEAGVKSGVPLRLNTTEAFTQRIVLEATVVDGFAGWEAGILPQLSLPPGNAGRMVTAIVGMPAEAEHKHCATVRVRAWLEGQPEAFTEVSFNAFAVQSPSPERRTLHWHALDSVTWCNHIDTLWWNTLENDPDDDGVDMFIRSCERNPTSASPVSNVPAGLYSYMDIETAHDLVLNTSASGKEALVTLVMRSEPVPAKVRLRVSLLHGLPLEAEALGEGVVEADVGTSPTPVEIPVPIEFTREVVAEGDPSRRVDGSKPLGLRIGYAPAEDPFVARVFMQSQGGQLELPVWDAVPRLRLGVGTNGGLLTVSTDAPPDRVLLNPGKAFGVNYTILNEGLAPDVGILEPSFYAGGTGWTAQAVPSQSGEMEPGEARTLTVQVTARGDALEGEEAVLAVTVRSRNDATAESSLFTTFVSTKGVEAGSGAHIQDEGGGGGGVPGFEFMLALAALGAAWAVRRR